MSFHATFLYRQDSNRFVLSIGSDSAGIEEMIAETFEDYGPAKIIGSVELPGVAGNILFDLCTDAPPLNGDVEKLIVDFLQEIFNLGRQSVLK